MGVFVCVCARRGGRRVTKQQALSAKCTFYLGVLSHTVCFLLKVRVCLQVRKGDRWDIVLVEESRMEQTEVLVTKAHPALPAVCCSEKK